MFGVGWGWRVRWTFFPFTWAWVFSFLFPLSAVGQLTAVFFLAQPWISAQFCAFKRMLASRANLDSALAQQDRLDEEEGALRKRLFSYLAFFL